MNTVETMTGHNGLTNKHVVTNAWTLLSAAQCMFMTDKQVTDNQVTDNRLLMKVKLL